MLKTAGIQALPNRGGADKTATKTGYTNASLSNFRKKMVEEEKLSEAGNMKHTDLTRKRALAGAKGGDDVLKM